MDDIEQIIRDHLHDKVKELQEEFPGQYVTVRAEYLALPGASDDFFFIAYTEKQNHSGMHAKAADAVLELIARREAA